MSRNICVALWLCVMISGITVFAAKMDGKKLSKFGKIIFMPYLLFILCSKGLDKLEEIVFEKGE